MKIDASRPINNFSIQTRKSNIASHPHAINVRRWSLIKYLLPHNYALLSQTIGTTTQQPITLRVRITHTKTSGCRSIP